MTEPRTIAERLDAAQSGEEFGHVLNDLFSVLERARGDALEDEGSQP